MWTQTRFLMLALSLLAALGLSCSSVGNSGGDSKTDASAETQSHNGTDTLEATDTQEAIDTQDGVDTATEKDTQSQTASHTDVEPWSFIVVGDSRGSDVGVNEEAWTHLVNAILGEDVDFVLFPGDLTTNGRSEQFVKWKSITQPLYDQMGVYVIRGNHEPSLSAWNDAFSGEFQLPQNGPENEKNLTYSVTHKNAMIIGLDNYVHSTKVNQSWLDVQLSANAKPHVFVFGHEPAFAASHKDTLDDYPEHRNAFWESLKAAGARAYFCGHDHFYAHARIDDDDADESNDIHQFIVGTAGAPLYDFNGNYTGDNGSYIPIQQHFSKKYGYMVIVVEGYSVFMTFKERDGDSYQAVDWFEYTVG
jgi:hypothetical protein